MRPSLAAGAQPRAHDMHGTSTSSCEAWGRRFSLMVSLMEKNTFINVLLLVKLIKLRIRLRYVDWVPFKVTKQEQGRPNLAFLISIFDGPQQQQAYYTKWDHDIPFTTQTIHF
jgi:hypothetical protein